MKKDSFLRGTLILLICTLLGIMPVGQAERDYLAPPSTSNEEPTLRDLEAKKPDLYHPDEFRRRDAIGIVRDLVQKDPAPQVLERGISLLAPLLLDSRSQIALNEDGTLKYMRTISQQMAEDAIEKIILLDKSNGLLGDLRRGGFLEGVSSPFERAVRIMVVAKISGIEPQQAENAFGMVAGYLYDPDSLVRLTADHVLEEIVRLNPERFLSQARSGDLTDRDLVRRRLMIHLGKIQGDNVVRFLETVAQDPNETIKTRISALEALGTRGQSGRIEQIVKEAKENELHWKRKTVSPLEYFEWVLLRVTAQKVLRSQIEASL